MSYVVLARKWRPQSFDDLVGQGHVSKTLANSIALGRVAHAFLFTGVRGVGKTTSARILAKALNCEQGPTIHPCQTCAACVEITNGSDIDVQEIDGASYNGVDDVRRLQETIPYRPNRDRFKIFIVDEVHMLSASAWNAFLKTLEEPPPHVKFIFATTEVGKVPVTILSRCQRYDFKLIGSGQVLARLKFVLEKEAIAADDAALALIAREAAGSMRDAMSLLDQVIAWSGPQARLTAEEVAKVLGVASRASLARLSRAVIAGDPKGALEIIGELAESGYDVVHVARDLLAYLRDLVAIKVAPDASKVLDVPDDDAAALREVASATDVDDIARLHGGLSKSYDDIAESVSPRAGLEMTLVRLARRPALVPLSDLLARLGELEARLLARGGSGPGGTSGGGAPRGGPGNDPRARANPGPRAEGAESHHADARDSDPKPRVESEGPRAAEAHAPELRHSASEQGVEERALRAPPVEAPLVEAQAPHPRTVREPVREEVRLEEPPRHTAEVAAAPKPREVRRPVGEPKTEEERLYWWSGVVERIRESDLAYGKLASFLERAKVVEVGHGKLLLEFTTSFEVDDARGDLRIVETHASAAFGSALEVTIRERSEEAREADTLAQMVREKKRARRNELDASFRRHPLVLAAIELLDGEIKDVRLPEDVDRAPVSVGQLRT